MSRVDQATFPCSYARRQIVMTKRTPQTLANCLAVLTGLENMMFEQQGKHRHGTFLANVDDVAVAGGVPLKTAKSILRYFREWKLIQVSGLDIPISALKLNKKFFQLLEPDPDRLKTAAEKSLEETLADREKEKMLCRLRAALYDEDFGKVGELNCEDPDMVAAAIKNTEWERDVLWAIDQSDGYFENIAYHNPPPCPTVTTSSASKPSFAVCNHVTTIGVTM